MIFLSQIYLDPFNPSVRQAMKNHQDMHRNIMKAFQGPRKNSEVLYRLVEKKDSYEIIVLSKERPKWEFIQSNGYICLNITDYSNILERFHDGVVLRFNLRAAATKKVKRNGAKNSSRVCLKTVEERAGWLERQAYNNGFELLEMNEVRSDILFSVRKTDDSFQFRATEFAGVLKIVDHELFSRSWPNGFGPEKAYGMGLMLLSRV